ncbi:type IV pili methyl-accepting chemotaxis transducer N-terminal domain-containing protein [Sulfuriferula sp.]|uniref:type IV pili methyl-accepting chemotaxis transducer N-terminal domain-containing protein n=1 Tax=Sulfuriferula sp. TaxID=2025307 RepID=UPI00272EFEE2|nr:type IV pili methyl-accepting chemotaxis transducer N-terminal domain-containing protein [Sulfuriferula sp.]MDP2027311.1 type IV pili methyl-accepting chemotaxis transducer N-terminal domain-containing protein [Sulfuriferula sp.]
MIADCTQPQTEPFPRRKQRSLPAELAHAINQAGRLRMLSQRMAKLHTLRLLGINEDSLLNQSVALFENSLNELMRKSPSSQIYAHFTALTEAWPAFRDAALNAGSVPELRTLAELDETVLRHAQQAVDALVQHAGNPIAAQISLYGRQRMLAQRITKLYLYQACGVCERECDTAMAQARQDFETCLQTAEVAVFAPYANSVLLLEHDLWAAFTSALDHFVPDRNDRIGLQSIHKLSEQLLEITDISTALQHPTHKVSL